MTAEDLLQHDIVGNDRDDTLVRGFADLPLPTLSIWLTAHEELRGNRRIRRVFDFLAEGLAAAIPD